MTSLAENIFQTSYTNQLLERFLRYVRTYSERSSQNADQGKIPSTSQQWGMAKLLSSELKELSLSDVQTTDFCYTYARLEASAGCEAVPPICYLSHIDTVEEVTGKDVKPQVHTEYNGKVLHLNNSVTLDPKDDAALNEAGQKGDTIITTDGTTLLGGDDKAGCAAIMTSLEYLCSHPELRHGAIEVIFSPDEETGHGMDKVPLHLLRSKQAYTVDGGHIGELETECFNAYKSDVVFTGHSVHTGTARPQLVNAVSMASSLVSLLPHKELPETTFGYEGFFAPMAISGSIEESCVSILLRDFSSEGIERRKKLVETLSDTVAQTFGGSATVTHTMQYKNMKQVLDKNPLVVENLVKAYKASGITPIFVPIRGGTDGSRLSEMGIPTPNIFTGTHNMHSRKEWVSLSQMIYATDVLIQLASIWAK